MLECCCRKLKKFPKIPTDGWLSQHQLGFLSVELGPLLLEIKFWWAKNHVTFCADSKQIRRHQWWRQRWPCSQSAMQLLTKTELEPFGLSLSPWSQRKTNPKKKMSQWYHTIGTFSFFWIGFSLRPKTETKRLKLGLSNHFWDKRYWPKSRKLPLNLQSCTS